MATHRDNIPTQIGMPYRGILSGRHKRLLVQQADRDPESLARCTGGGWAGTTRSACPQCSPETYARVPSKPVSGNDVIAWP